MMASPLSGLMRTAALMAGSFCPGRLQFVTDEFDEAVRTSVPALMESMKGWCQGLASIAV
jgi:hypothetical protein